MMGKRFFRARLGEPAAWQRVAVDVAGELREVQDAIHDGPTGTQPAKIVGTNALGCPFHRVHDAHSRDYVYVLHAERRRMDAVVIVDEFAPTSCSRLICGTFARRISRRLFHGMPSDPGVPVVLIPTRASMAWRSSSPIHSSPDDERGGRVRFCGSRRLRLRCASFAMQRAPSRCFAPPSCYRRGRYSEA